MNVMDASELYDPEFRKLIKSKKQTVIIPVGSLEQHGAHLPITTDSDIVTEIASRLAKKCGFIVFPTISYGVSFEHDPLFNTSIDGKNLSIMLMNICFSILSRPLIDVNSPTAVTKKDGEKFLSEIVRNLSKECQS